MRPLIPEIVIGGKYHLHIRTTEGFCPHCGKQQGSENNGERCTVYVERQALPELECHVCGKTHTTPEGFWYVVALDGEHQGCGTPVPYTQLQETEEFEYV